MVYINAYSCILAAVRGWIYLLCARLTRFCSTLMQSVIKKNLPLKAASSMHFLPISLLLYNTPKSKPGERSFPSRRNTPSCILLDSGSRTPRTGQDPRGRRPSRPCCPADSFPVLWSRCIQSRIECSRHQGHMPERLAWPGGECVELEVDPFLVKGVCHRLWSYTIYIRLYIHILQLMSMHK